MLSSALLVAALASSLGSAAPSAPRIGVPSSSGRFSITQIPNPSYKPNGPIALAKAYQKYGIAMPDDLARVVADWKIARRDTGSVEAIPEEHDIEYLSPIKVGTPGVTMNMCFDTGSSDLWVISSAVRGAQSHSLYDATKSSTSSKLQGHQWTIEYGDGSGASGDVYNDIVAIGGLAVSKQAVEVATSLSNELLTDANLDGILGLAFSSINSVLPTAQKTWFDNIQGSLDKKLFTADLKLSAPGTYNFGFIDKSTFKGDLMYTPVDSSSGFWLFDSPSYAVGSAALKSDATQNIMDTGTTLLLLPPRVVSAYWSQVTDAGYNSQVGGIIFPCKTTPPDYTFTMKGSAKITVPGKLIKFETVSQDGQWCYGGIQDSLYTNVGIYGGVALKSMVVVFDAENKQLGVAPKTV